MAEPGNRAENEAWIEFGETVIRKAEALHIADLEVLDQDIGPTCEVAHNLLALGCRDVQRHGAFATVRRQEIDRIAGAVAISIHQERRPPDARLVA